jgi:hypothetical protein
MNFMMLCCTNLLLFFIFGSLLASAPAAPVEPKPDESEQTLLRERRDYLRNVLVQRQDAFKAGRLGHDLLLDAHRALLLAELELATKPAERVALCDRFAREAARRQDAVEGARKAGRSTELEYTRGIAACREDELLIHRTKHPEPADKERAAQLLALLRKRCGAYQDALKRMNEEVEAGRRSPAEAEQGLLAAALHAQLDLVEKPAERIDLLQQHRERLTQMEKVVQIQVDAGRLAHPEELQARAAVLATEIALIREKSRGSAAPEKLAELLREQRKVGQELLELRYVQYEAGKCPFAALLATLDERLRAELSAADKPEERAAALRAHLADLKKIEAAAKVRMEASFIPQADYETLCAVRLDVQVRLLRAEREAK